MRKARLTELISLFPVCHGVKHMGLRKEDTIAHLPFNND
jgi:hypothetical protein